MACGLKGRWLPGDLRHPELRHTHLAMDTRDYPTTAGGIGVQRGNWEEAQVGTGVPCSLSMRLQHRDFVFWPPFSKGSLYARVLTATHWLMGEEVRLSAEKWFSQSHR